MERKLKTYERVIKLNTCKLCSGDYDFRKVAISEVLDETSIVFTENMHVNTGVTQFRYCPLCGNKLNTNENVPLVTENKPKSDTPIICFHKPNEPNGYLSNWYKCSFTVANITYTSVEQYMMYSKAVLFGDLIVAQRIMQTNDDVALIKTYGRCVRNYVDEVWSDTRYEVVHKAVYAKFAQNEPLKQLLLATDNALLAECAVSDRIWGIGLAMHDPDRLNIAHWKGLNLLGRVLMQTRSELRSTK